MNPIVNIAKETWDSHDAHACAAEWLFQAARLADELGVPHEIDYTDPAGPLDLETALATGEDSAYWDAVMALWEDQKLVPHIDPNDFDTQVLAASWAAGDRPDGYNPHAAFEHVRVALLTFDRMYELTKEED